MIEIYEIKKRELLRKYDSLEKTIMMQNAEKNHFNIRELEILSHTQNISDLYAIYNIIYNRKLIKLQNAEKQIKDKGVLSVFKKSYYAKNCNINVLLLIALAENEEQAIIIRRGFQTGTGDTEASYIGNGYPTFNSSYLEPVKHIIPDDVEIVEIKEYKYSLNLPKGKKVS